MRIFLLIFLIISSCSSNDEEMQPVNDTPNNEDNTDQDDNSDSDSSTLNLPEIFVMGNDDPFNPTGKFLSKISSEGEIVYSTNLTDETGISYSAQHHFDKDELYLHDYSATQFFRKNLITNDNFYIEDICDPAILTQSTIAFSENNIIILGLADQGPGSRKYDIDSNDCTDFVTPSGEVVFNRFAKVRGGNVFYVGLDFDLNSYFIESANISTSTITGKFFIEDPADSLGNGNPFVADFVGDELHVWSETQYTIYNAQTLEVLERLSAPYQLHGEFSNTFVDQKMAGNVILAKGSCPPPCSGGSLVPTDMDTGEVVEDFSAYPSKIEEGLEEYAYASLDIISATGIVEEKLLVYGINTIFNDEYIYAILYVNFKGEIVHALKIPFEPVEIHIPFYQ